MPLARIITHVAGEMDELAAGLCARGFDVEIVSPDQTPTRAADLEIKVETCAADKALSSVEDISQAQDLSVFIAPGAIVESFRPSMRAREIAQPINYAEPAEIADVPQLAALIIPNDGEDFSQVEDPSVFSAPDEIGESAAPPVMASEIAEPVTDTEAAEVADVQPLPALIAREDVAEVEVLETPRPLAPAADLYPEAQEIFSQLSQLVSRQLPAEQELQQAAAMTESEAVAQPENEPPSDWPIWQPVADDEPIFATPATPAEGAEPVGIPLAQSAVRSRRSIRDYGLLSSRIWQSQEFFWKAAVLVAMASVSALLLGASAHRFSPLPRGLEQRLGGQEQVPFGRTKGAPVPQNMAKSADLPLAKPAPAAELKRIVVHEPIVVSPTLAKPAPARFARPVATAKRRHHSARSSEADYVAEDTVVRHSIKPPVSATRAQAEKKPGIKPPVAATRAQAEKKKLGIKKYSDLN